jgi:membrane protein implicated in regulation of membrane protease activity
MKKVPWDVFAWICMELAFFLTLGIVVAYIALNAVAGATSGGVTLFTNWWQSALFIGDIVAIVGAVFFFYRHFKRKARERAEKRGGKKDK